MSTDDCLLTSTDDSLDQQWYTQQTQTVFMTHSGFSSASISTTATAPNLPGTGRVIGLAYDALGKVLVRRINRLAYRFRSRRRSGTVMGGVESLTSAIDAGSVLTVSTFSTTATQANLPGTGRVLGLAYDAIGKIIEQKLNKIADKLERGPNATAQKIVRKEQQIREKRWRPSTSEYIQDLPDIIAVKDRKALAALCERLLKYTKSHVLSTKLQALTRITNLTLHEPYFHTLLSDLHAATILSEVHFDLTAFRDLDPAVRTASELALVAMSEVNVVVLNIKIRSICDSFDWISGMEPLKISLSDLFSYLPDTTIAFLVLRLLDENLEGIATVFDTHENNFVIATLVNALHFLVVRTTEGVGEKAISWSDMDSIIIKGLEIWGPRRGNTYIRQHFIKLIRLAFGYSAFLPETTAFMISVFDSWWSDAHLQEGLRFMPDYLWAVVEEEFQTLDLYKLSSQQLSLTVMDMFISEACVSLLGKLVDPAVLALRQAILEHQRFQDHQQAWVSGFIGQKRVVSADKIRAIVNTILPLLTCGDSGRAAYSLAVISQIDIYHWSETSKVLEECGLASLIQPLVYPAREPSGVQHIFRTCCVNEDTHVEVFTLRQSTHPLRFKSTTARQREFCTNCHEPFQQHTWFQLTLLTTDVLWCEVGSDLSIDRNVHFPLQIGTNRNRETLYLGAAFSADGPFLFEDAKLQAIPGRELKSGKWFTHTRDRLGVLVLRYDPNAYANMTHPTIRQVEGACHWTGPFFWRPFQM